MRAKGEPDPMKPPRLNPIYGMNDVGETAPSPMSPMIPKQSGTAKPKQRSLGDFAQNLNEPYQRHWDVQEKNLRLPPQMPVIVPPVEVDPQKMLEISLLAQKLKEVLTCGVYFTKNENWIVPPIEALGAILITPPAGIALPGGVPGPFTPLITHTVPERWIFIGCAIGNALETPPAFGAVDFRIRINNRPVLAVVESSPLGIPVRNGIFTAQVGDMVSPVRLCMPILAKGQDVITVEARNLVAAPVHNAFFRLDMYQYPARMITNDGSYGEYHQV